ncbi:hypothetical protein GCM10010517_72000 [Streptosporangium fragile]|uniref:Uncharacterized protein n=1 Tax=Streptosporangium fragile TaxID=46186 RepID=A0ABN3W874_9ACTN
MRIVIEGTRAQIDRLRQDPDLFLCAPAHPLFLVLRDVRIRKDPYRDAYRLTADASDREEAV